MANFHKVKTNSARICKTKSLLFLAWDEEYLYLLTVDTEELHTIQEVTKHETHPASQGPAMVQLINTRGADVFSSIVQQYMISLFLLMFTPF
jgi:hypothetical protein